LKPPALSGCILAALLILKYLIAPREAEVQGYFSMKEDLIK